MSESALWKTIRQNMSHLGHLARIENGVDRGTPDLNGCVRGTEFWLELKEMPRWCRRPEEVFKIDHYTKQQRFWLRTRGLAGGRAFLFLRVVKPRAVYLLFDWHFAFHYVGKVPQAQLEAQAFLKFGPKFDTEALLNAIRSWEG